MSIAYRQHKPNAYTESVWNKHGFNVTCYYTSSEMIPLGYFLLLSNVTQASARET